MIGFIKEQKIFYLLAFIPILFLFYRKIPRPKKDT